MYGKRKYVTHYLNTNELEYNIIDNIEVRMNIDVRYHEGKDKCGEPYPMHPLDEVQESIKQWTKRIILDPDKDSWRQHSPNVTSSHMCIDFEEVEFEKSQLDYGDGVKHNDTHHSCKTVVPKLIAGRERLYKWVLAMFKEYIPGRECSYKYRVELISELRSKIKIPVNTSNNYYRLDECIISMFGDSYEVEKYEARNT